MGIEKNKPTKQEVQAGQAIFVRPVLRLYDFWVLKFTNPFIWRCPTQALLDGYNNHISLNHLDVGIGTGYYLDRCCFPGSNVRLALMDMNADTLTYCAERLARFHPVCYQRNIYEPIQIEGEKFDSIGLNYVLHCLPGDIFSKESVLRNLKALLNEKGVLFGSTLLMHETPLSFGAKLFMKVYNAKKVFSNQADTLKDLKTVLAEQFRTYEVKMVGCVALFWARK